MDAPVTEPPPASELLDHEVRAIVATVAAGLEAGLDVVGGGEVAAVLQGIPVTTRHLVLHVRPEDLELLLRMASKRWQDVARHAVGRVLRHGPVIAGPVRPASRLVTGTERGSIPVVDLDELVAGAHGVGPSVVRIHARLSRADGAQRTVS